MKKYLTMCFSYFFQDCKMSCQSSCVGVLWRQPSAMWHATRRASCSAATTTAGADALPASQNATVPSLTSRSWRRTWRRAKRPGAASTKSSWSQVRTGCFLLNFVYMETATTKVVLIEVLDECLKRWQRQSKKLQLEYSFSYAELSFSLTLIQWTFLLKTGVRVLFSIKTQVSLTLSGMSYVTYAATVMFTRLNVVILTQIRLFSWT